MQGDASSSSGLGNAGASGDTNPANKSSNSNASNAPTSASWPRPHTDPDRRQANNSAPKTGVVQPKPQALSKRAGPSSIIVSPRQKGNPVCNEIKSVPWEYGDIPADYVLGLTTCALFLSLKYHRLHPEYIYTRIKGLQGKYNLRIVLVMVDIQNHEESLRELSKTSLINSLTLIMCWSATEGARYLEIFKTYENASPNAIKQHQSSAYADRMVDFITTPRSINKTDAVSLVSQFGTLRTAVNARHEEIAGIAGWGEKKVQRWCAAVREPFRIQRAARRGVLREVTRDSMAGSRETSESRDPSASPAPAAAALGQSPLGRGVSTADGRPAKSDADRRPPSRLAESLFVDEDISAEDEAAMLDALNGPAILPPRAAAAATTQESSRKRKAQDDELGEGVMAALSKLRKENG